MWIRKGNFPMTVSIKSMAVRGQSLFAQHGNWRVVFRFQEGEVSDVDLIDYH